MAGWLDALLACFLASLGCRWVLASLALCWLCGGLCAEVALRGGGLGFGCRLSCFWAGRFGLGVVSFLVAVYLGSVLLRVRRWLGLWLFWLFGLLAASAVLNLFCV